MTVLIYYRHIQDTIQLNPRPVELASGFSVWAKGKEVNRPYRLWMYGFQLWTKGECLA